MLLGKTKKRIEEKEAEIKLNLSNNYKDTAYQCFVEYVDVINELKGNGKIGDKDYEKLVTKIEEYKKTFKNYIK